MNRGERIRRSKAKVKWRKKNADYAAYFGTEHKNKIQPHRWNKEHPSFTYGHSLKPYKKIEHGKERAKQREATKEGEIVTFSKNSVKWSYW